MSDYAVVRLELEAADGRHIYYVGSDSVDQCRQLAEQLGLPFASITSSRLSTHNGFFKIWGIGELADALKESGRPSGSTPAHTTPARVRPTRERWRKDWGQTYAAQVLEIYSPLGKLRHLRVWRHDRRDTRIPWDVLQQIKNEMLGAETTAIEVFPADSQLVDKVNMRHLWEVPRGFLPFNLATPSG